MVAQEGRNTSVDRKMCRAEAMMYLRGSLSRQQRALHVQVDSTD